MSESYAYMEAWLQKSGFYLYHGKTTEQQYIVSWECRYAARPYVVQGEDYKDTVSTLFKTVKEDLMKRIEILEA